MTKLLTYVEIDVDFCSLTYGVAPCLARLGYADGVHSGPMATEFDGDAYLTRTAGMTGAADSKLLTISSWIRMPALPGASATIVAAETTLAGVTLTWEFFVDATGHVSLLGKNSAGTTILAANITGAIPDVLWHHYLVSLDLSSTSKRWVYVDDVAATMTWTTYTNDTVDFTAADWSVGSIGDGTLSQPAELADLWVAPGLYLDLSVSGNRRLFIDANKRAVWLGANGEIPTATSPLLYLSGALASWATNLGIGGGMTMHGTLFQGVSLGAIKCFNSRATCQSKSTFTNVPVTLRWAIDCDYLPPDIDAIPSMDSYSFTPAVISLGGDLGQRASVSVTFHEHRWPDTGPGFDPYVATRGYDPFKQGTFWAKFRARQTFLQGRPLRLISGELGQALGDMETRNYTIDSFTGPTPDGQYTIVAKDILKLADGDQSQAPALSNGFLVADITDTVTTFTLSPTGVGAEYPASGFAAIGGAEVVEYFVDNPPGNDANTLLLLHFTGSNGSTTFTDSSPFARACAANGNAQIDTSQSRFFLLTGNGFSSGKFDGSGDYVSVADSNDWTFAGDFTIDAYVQSNSLASKRVIACHQTDGNNLYSLYVGTDGSLNFFMNSGGTQIFAFGTAAGLIGTGGGVWHHVAVVRSGTTWRLFVDGVVAATTTSSVTIPNYTSTFRVGMDTTTANSWSGWIMELRVSRVARWTANFTLKLSPYQSSSDIVFMYRGQQGTDPATHSAQDRFQWCFAYFAADPALIIADLMINYAGIPSGYIDLTGWMTETAAYLGQVYSAVVAQPTAVSDLISELIEQAALAVWWDDQSEAVRLQVLRAISTSAMEFNSDIYVEDSLSTAEQPDKRLSQVWVYFGQRSPLGILTDPANYRSAEAVVDLEAETDYGAPAVKQIFSRWIPQFGRTVATKLGQIQLGRFRNPPRQIGFSLLRNGDYSADLGVGYQVQGWTLQDATGALVDVPVQVTQLTPTEDKIAVLAEEMIFIQYAATDTNTHDIIVDSNTQNFNLRTVHDTLFPTPVAGNVVNVTVNSGVIVSATSASQRAFDVGSWPAGVTVNVVLASGCKLEAAGGAGGHGGNNGGAGSAGGNGGTALYSRYAFNLTLTGAAIWSGGGGGGGGSGDGFTVGPNGGGGGGGGGIVAGAGGSTGSGSSGTYNGTAGTATAGGVGGNHGNTGGGGAGGAPGSNGVGGGSNTSGGGAHGNAGPAIDGISYATVTGSGDVRGTQIN